VKRVQDRPILITGGAGFLGVNLADRLLGQGQRVIVLDNLSRAGVEENLASLERRHSRGLSVMLADIRDPQPVAEAVAKASAVLHLAAQVAVTSSLDDPLNDFAVNAAGTLHVLEAIRRQPVPPPLIFASTNKVYGKLLDEHELLRTDIRWQPRDTARLQGCDERTPLDFYSPYGCSKGVADQYVLDYARTFGLPTVVFRMSCLYGPHQRGTEDQGWVAHFLIQAMQGRGLTLYGDGRQVRDALYVDDAAEAWLTALAQIDRVRGRAFNLGGGPANAVSLCEMLKLIERLTGRAPQVRHGDWRPGDQLWYVSDTRALTAATGWRPSVGVEEGLRRLHRWLAAAAVPRVPVEVAA
jgi:CDP-paratose 2-epimerase